jgi:hypothetical protein
MISGQCRRSLIRGVLQRTNWVSGTRIDLPDNGGLKAGKVDNRRTHPGQIYLLHDRLTCITLDPVSDGWRMSFISHRPGIFLGAASVHVKEQARCITVGETVPCSARAWTTTVLVGVRAEN